MFDMEKKELVISLAEAEQEMFSAVNAIMQKNGLPCYLMEYIVDKAHRQLVDGKNSELAAAYERANGNAKMTQDPPKETASK